MGDQGFVYMMASRRNGTIYIGVTSDLPKRVWEHRTGAVEGFTKKYGCSSLVWFEVHDDLQEARQRELRIKKWNRLWKLSLIERQNPDWRDADLTLCPREGGDPVWAPAFTGAQRGRRTL